MKKLILLSILCMQTLYSFGLNLELGQKYNYKYSHQLELQVTTLEDTLKKFGEPRERFDISDKKHKYVILRYLMGEYSMFDGKGRLTNLEFKDGLLIAYIFGSNYNKDRTNFNYKRSEDIKLADNIKDVIKVLGEPTGELLCPANTGRYSGFCKKGEYAYAWAYVRNVGLTNQDDARIRVFLIGIDKEGKIIEIERERVFPNKFYK